MTGQCPDQSGYGTQVGDLAVPVDQLAGACGAPSGSVLLSAAEAETAWQALADAAAWRAGRADDGNGCFGCVRAQARARAGHAADPDLARCPEHARYDTIVADYAALRIRLGGDRR